MWGKANTCVSVFSGAGGLDLGLEMAGWRTVYAADIDQDSVATLRANAGRKIGTSRIFESTVIERADIREVSGRDILSKASLRRGGVDLLAGGPPCQSWSSAGHQLGFDDPRGRLFAEFIRVANQLDARWLLLENVRGLLTARGFDKQPGSALEQIRRDLLNAGFQTTVTLLNAADYGVPQRRVRLFMIGYRTGDAPSFPVPTHSKLSDLDTAKRWVSVSKALAKLGKLKPEEIIRPSGRLAEELADIPAGCGVKSPGKAERTRPSGHWGYKQGAFVADTLQPARTVTANRQQDWIRDQQLGLRRLCPRECAAIQSFPESWKFVGNETAQYRLIGNAVPPLLAKAIGRQLLEELGRPQQSEISPLTDILPLSAKLAYHIRYTAREEVSNGHSRRSAPSRRSSRTAVVV